MLEIKKGKTEMQGDKQKYEDIGKKEELKGGVESKVRKRRKERR